MMQFVTGYDIAVEAKMVRTAFAGTILLVEGDDDILFFERFTNAEECTLLPARGKVNVLTALELLEEQDFGGTLGIVDADFWHLLPANEQSGNVCVTDHHDVEIMIIESEALVRVLNEYGSPDKIRAFVEQSGSPDIRHALYERAFPIGILRLISLKRGLRLKFESMRYDRILSRDTLAVDIERLINTVLQVSRCNLACTGLRAALDEEGSEQSEVDRPQLCCGDDLIAVICIGLRRALGTRDLRVASRSNIASSLRLAYDSMDLKNIGLYACLTQWEANNPPYKVINI